MTFNTLSSQEGKLITVLELHTSITNTSFPDRTATAQEHLISCL